MNWFLDERSQQVLKQAPIAALTISGEYVNGRREADELAARYGFTVADMPLVLQAMASSWEIRWTVRSETVDTIDTITSEYYGKREGEQVYECWHSVGSLATVEGIEKAFSQNTGRRSMPPSATPEEHERALLAIGDHGFMQIADDEWAEIGTGAYEGREVARIHLENVKRGNVPTPGTPYTSFVRLDKDAPKINVNSQLDYDAFLRDDRVLMIAGSPDSREALAKMLLGRKDMRLGRERECGEGWDSVENKHNLPSVDFSAKAKGRPVRLGYANEGFTCYDTLTPSARFLTVAPQNQLQQSIVRPTLEQILAVINDPDLDRRKMIKAISKLYQNLSPQYPQ